VHADGPGIELNALEDGRGHVLPAPFETILARVRSLFTDVPPAHRALAAKIDAFDGAVRARRAADMRCREGCSACCGEQLTVCDVEAALVREGASALAEDARDRLRARIDALGVGSPCVFLDDGGRCAVYASRPMVCRTQGLPLRYPEGVIPVEAIFSRARGKGDALTWCPLNFTEQAPRPEDVLDAERVDTMVALSNREAGGDPERRTSLADLAREVAGRSER
jgi:hypothetical protein